MIMNYEIIFYRSGKTSEIQNLLSETFSEISLSLNEACAAVSPKELTEILGRAIKRNKLILIVGGDTGKYSTENILDKVLRSDKSEILSETLNSNDDPICRIKRAKDQTIVTLPDDTDKISDILSDLKKNLSDIYKLKKNVDNETVNDNIAEDIDKQMARTKRVRVAPAGSTAEKRVEKKLSALKATIAILLLLAALQITAASFLFITQS